MGLSDKLYSASFRGVEFFIEATNIEGGRKQSTFEFVNTGRRSNQDLGKYERKYDITAYIMGNELNYFQRRDALLNALEQPGAGELIHPFYGNLRVTTGIYKLNESIKSLGYSTINFVAEVVNDEILSEQGNPFIKPQNDVTVSQIESSAQIAKNDLASDLANNSVLTNSFPSNLTSMEDILKNGLNKFSKTLKPLADSTQNAINWSNSISGLIEDTRRLINNPTVLFSNIIDGITAVDNLTSNSISAVARIENLFNYGKTNDTNPIFVSRETIIGDINTFRKNEVSTNKKEFDQNGVIIPKTKQQIDRLNNAQIAVGLFRTSAFIEYMNQLSRVEFDNTNEIDFYISNIEQQYNELSQFLEPNSLESLSNLRDLLRILFNNKRLSTNKISQVEVYKEPVSILSFNLYETSNMSSQIIKLNGISDVMEITGEIEVENNDSIRN